MNTYAPCFDVGTAHWPSLFSNQPPTTVLTLFTPLWLVLPIINVIFTTSNCYCLKWLRLQLLLFWSFHLNHSHFCCCDEVLIFATMVATSENNCADACKNLALLLLLLNVQNLHRFLVFFFFVGAFSFVYSRVWECKEGLDLVKFKIMSIFSFNYWWVCSVIVKIIGNN